jgi:hypothetical protein
MKKASFCWLFYWLNVALALLNKELSAIYYVAIPMPIVRKTPHTLR